MSDTFGISELQRIKTCRLFAGLDEEELQRALGLLDASVAEYGRGAFIHRADERLAFFGLVLSGSVQVCTDDMNGDLMMMANVTEGETFGESLCYLRVEQTKVFISTQDRAKVLKLRTDAFLAPRGEADSLTGRLFGNFVSMLAERTLSMNERIQVLSKKTLREKLKTFFSQCEKKYGSRSFSLPLDRAGLAIYLGSDRAALSRELSAMRRAGIIDFSGNYFRIL